MTEEPLPYYKSEIPEGVSGEWSIEKFSVRPPQGRDDRPEPFKARPGRYTRLRHRATTFMTDLYDEWWTQRRVLREALTRGGHALITGLGLGVVVESILRPAESPVETVTVLELSEDVIRLAAPHLLQRYRPRLRILQADAFTWVPAQGERFSVVWHDIWPNPLDASIFPEIDALHEHYRDWCDWQWSWPTDYIEAADVELLENGQLRRRS